MWTKFSVRALFATATLAVATSSAACHPCPDGTLRGFLWVRDGAVLSVNGLDDGGTTWGTLDDTPLSACTEVTGGIEITGRVSTLRAFDSLERIGGPLVMHTFYGEDDIDGFAALKQVRSIEFDNGSLNEWEHEDENGQPPVRALSITGFDALTEIPGDLYLGNTRIRNVTGFRALTRIGGTLWLWRSSLRNLEGMTNLESIGGSVMAWSTSADLRSLSKLRSIGGSLDIYGLGARGTLGLVSLREIGGEAALRDLSPLEDIGLPQLESVGGKFVLSGAEGLTEMVGLDSLRQVGGNLAIGGNRNLPSEKVYEWLDATRPAVDGDIIVCNNLDGQSEPCPPPPTP